MKQNGVISGIDKRLRVAGSLLIAGLLVELVSLYWSHPTAFMLFLFLGGALMGLGILLYLYSIIAPPPVAQQK